MSEHAFMSASGTHSWLRCSLSPWLSMLANGEIPEHEAEEYTTEGTHAHQVLEQLIKGDNVPADSLVYDGAKQSLDWFCDWAGCWRKFAQSETRVEFSRWVPGGFGTCDVSYFDESIAALYIADYKWGVGVEKKAPDNPQLYTYGIGKLDELMLFDDVDTVHMAIMQPRLGNFSTVTVSAERLLAWGDYVLRPAAMEVLNNPRGNPTDEGCQFCDGAAMCRPLYEHTTSEALPIELIDDAETFVEQFIADPEQLGKFLSRQTLLNKLIKRAKERGHELLARGEDVPHVKLVAGSGKRAWTDEQKASAALGRAGVKAGERYTKKLISPAQAEKIIGADNKVLKNYAVKTPGKPTIAPITDKRDSVVLTKSETLDYFDDES